MAPLSMFRSRTFSAANLMTLLVYGALGAVLFFLRAASSRSRSGTTRSRPVLATLALPITMLLLLLAHLDRSRPAPAHDCR